ncbi:MAG: hypothetical protein PHG06_07200 [Parabacteroides sp.]|nr:hypothetical protein [Parabacteroides sp.]
MCHRFDPCENSSLDYFSDHIYKRNLSREEFDLIDHIMDEEESKFIYRSNKKEVDTRFVALGWKAGKGLFCKHY